MSYDSPINANDASFERIVLQAQVPVAVVFWSAREVPRQQLNDVLEQTARQYADQVLVVKLDVADAPQARTRYEVEVLPQFLFFRQGKLVARAKGLPDTEMLHPWMEYLLGRGPKPAAPRSAAPKPTADEPSAEEPRPGHGQSLEVSDADFERAVVGANLPVMVDFWAEWCGPCIMIKPVVEQLAREFAGRALIAEINVDANPAAASRYGVQSIPTLLFFRDGQVVDQVIGTQSAQVLREKLEALL